MMPVRLMASGKSSATWRYGPTWMRSAALGTACTTPLSTRSSPALPFFALVTEKAGRSMRPQSWPVVAHRLSCTAPSPTTAKSDAQASLAAVVYSVSLASCRLSSI